MTTKWYQGSFDHLATFSCLRRHGILGRLSYLSITDGAIEIGWCPVGHLVLLDGVPSDDWQSQVADFADRAEQWGRNAVGYVGFDAIDGHNGTLPDRSGDRRPLVQFMIAGQVLTFFAAGVLHCGSAPFDAAPFLSPRRDHDDAHVVPDVARLVGETTKSAFVDAVRHAVEQIAAGEYEKVVLSRHQIYEDVADALVLFARLTSQQRDAFLLCFDDVTAVVPSPELLIAVDGRNVMTNPLAGTRPRSGDPTQDDWLARDLRRTHKDIVEHAISVMAMTDDLSGVCEPDSLVVSRLLEVVRCPTVQHLSSIIRGQLNRDRHAIDALWAVFPAITVTGLPRASAVTALRALESHPRFLYAGAVGSVRGRDHALFFLAIRSMFCVGSKTFIHAGAGIVAESVPEDEWLETSHKLLSMQRAMGMGSALRESGLAAHGYGSF